MDILCNENVDELSILGLLATDYVEWRFCQEGLNCEDFPSLKGRYHGLMEFRNCARQFELKHSDKLEMVKYNLCKRIEESDTESPAFLGFGENLFFDQEVNWERILILLSVVAMMCLHFVRKENYYRAVRILDLMLAFCDSCKILYWLQPENVKEICKQ